MCVRMWARACACALEAAHVSVYECACALAGAGWRTCGCACVCIYIWMYDAAQCVRGLRVCVRVFMYASIPTYIMYVCAGTCAYA